MPFCERCRVTLGVFFGCDFLYVDQMVVPFTYRSVLPHPGPLPKEEREKTDSGNILYPLSLWEKTGDGAFFIPSPFQGEGKKTETILRLKLVRDIKHSTVPA
ncbi:hypothetical protein VW41_16355 [Klebsiella michiganensis]|nr:hypothetical protein VW41_16355 [Klebsiella michiganensis]